MVMRATERSKSLTWPAVLNIESITCAIRHPRSAMRPIGGSKVNYESVTLV